MRMSHAHMYARLLAGDASCNGRFFTGVLTTGIYCLPSCGARKPKAENVRFFSRCPKKPPARPGCGRAGSAIRTSSPGGADPVLESIEEVVAEIRSGPGNFSDAGAIVRRSGFGTTRAFELFRQHFHATPADLLLRARLDRAKLRLIESRRSRFSRSAGDAGFESLSVFHEHFRQFNGLTPGAYRDLASARGFRLELPAGFPLACLRRRALSRDTHEASPKN